MTVQGDKMDTKTRADNGGTQQMDDAKTARGHLQKGASLIQPARVLPVHTMLLGSGSKTQAVKGVNQ